MTTNDPAVMLPEVMSKVAGMGPTALKAVHRFILQLEIESLAREIQDDAEALRVAGKLEPELIDAAIREHRQRHPYCG